MFTSFFPKPKLFLISALFYTALVVAFWYLVFEKLGISIGFIPAKAPAEPIIGLGHFVTPDFLWFYLYAFLVCFLYAAFWFFHAPHRWQWWSVSGSMLIMFSTYFSVQVSVAINNWRRPFFDKVQLALSGKDKVSVGELYSLLITFAEIAFVWIVVYVLTRFFVCHYVFRWRTAMNDYYLERWPEIRCIEGAAQRVQEDTMRFASIMEDLGVQIVESIMTLFAFLPVLFALSSYVSELPLLGKVAAPLFWASIFWSMFGTLLLACVGIKLPGLNFLNQRQEAAFRKELVYGEDDENRAEPMTVSELFAQVRRSYFRLYFHYVYFNIFRSSYIQADNIFVYVLLIPTIAAGKITFGLLQQILTAFSQVSSSFQYLVNSWTTIIELLSIHKRLIAFEKAFLGQPLSGFDSKEEEGASWP
ncbi:MAG: peptide antibiotic transporter SbmA [Hyphomicrobiaceae bacterium]